MMDGTLLYPMRFEPLFQYRIWGGTHLQNLLHTPLPEGGPFGEAWVLSDRDDHPTRVANGALAGRTLAELREAYGEKLIGAGWSQDRRFPLLLKFLDARQVLSVQVHPADHQSDLLPPGESGKTEAWVILEAGPESIVYAGLAADQTKESLAAALRAGEIQNHLAAFRPEAGDTVFIPAGTVHTMGGLVAFEVQENSDMTFRLYDWGNVDAKTGQPRELHIEAGLASISLPQEPVRPVRPELKTEYPVRRELLVNCEHFTLWRVKGETQFTVGEVDAARVVVCLEGSANLESSSGSQPVSQGQTWFLPAEVGACTLNPHHGVTVLEIGLPDQAL